METLVRTSCPRDCPDACGILAHVRDGKITRIQGDPEHPVTRGFLCERTSRFLARQYDPQRLTMPLLRRQGVLEPVSWDEALEVCAGKLLQIRRESGPAAIFHYRSGGSLGVLKGLSDLLFDRFGPVTTQRGSVCDGAGMAAQLMDFGDCDASDLDDLAQARTIVLWGKNPAVSSPHLLPRLQQAKRRGTALVLVDPIRHRMASLCDRVIQPRPGGDLALALGVARLVFDQRWDHPDAPSWCDHLDEYRGVVGKQTASQWAAEAGVTADELSDLARRIACCGPTTLFVGWGMQRRSNGAAIVRAIDALGAMTGNIGVPGGCVSFYFKRRAAFDTSVLRPAGPSPRSIREPLLARDLVNASDPPIRAVWISCGNPVAMLPDSHATARALSSRELCVVVDSFLTDTAKAATVVLPCATFLEDDDVVGAYGHPYLGVVQPAHAPLGQARRDLEILQALGARLGLGGLLDGPARDWKKRVLGAVSLEALEGGAVRCPVAPYVAFDGRRFPTPSGKVNLLHETPVARPADPPLTLMAISTPASQCSQWSPSEPHEELAARIHPRSCGELADGSIATLSSAWGSLRVRVRYDTSVREGLVVVPKGGSLSLGRGANALLSGRLTDLGEGAALYEEPVWLGRYP